MTQHRNEFFAMGFPADESAVDLAMKAELASGISKYLEEKQMAQSDAAKLFGVPQPVISKITTGNLEKLSLTYLWKLLYRMGLPVRAQTGTHPDETVVFVGSTLRIAVDNTFSVGPEGLLSVSTNSATATGARRPPQRISSNDQQRKSHGEI